MLKRLNTLNNLFFFLIILASGLQLEGGSSEKEGKSEPSFGKRRIHDLSLYMNVTGSMNEGYILIFVNIILLIFKEPVLTTFIFQLNININVYIIYIYHWMNFPIIHLFFFSVKLESGTNAICIFSLDEIFIVGSNKNNIWGHWECVLMGNTTKHLFFFLFLKKGW